jgi:DNA repair exonuclease SbcCD ATPase subunit
MAIRISNIHMHAFRGIPDYNLELDGKSILLKGENGTGKSSIIDAFEFFFTGTINHLEGIQGLSLNRDAVHVNFEPQDLYVSLQITQGQMMKRTLTEQPVPPNTITSFFENAKKGTFILRRAQMLEFIIAKPRERFSALANIMGLAFLDDVELNLMNIRDTAKGELSVLITRKNDLFNELSSTIGSEVTNLENALELLNALLKKDNLPELVSFDVIESYREESLHYDQIWRIDENWKVLDRLMTLVKEDPFPEDMTHQISAFNRIFSNFKKEKQDENLEYTELLSRGKEIIISEKRITCPLCEQEINCLSVLETIDDRLETLSNLSENASQLREMIPSIVETLDEIKSEIKILEKELGKIDEFTTERSKLHDALADFSTFMQSLRKSEALKKEIPLNQYIHLHDDIKSILKVVADKCETQLSQLELSPQQKEIMSIASKLIQVGNTIDNIAGNEKDLSRLNKRYVIAEKLYSTFSEVKKQKIQEVYDIIKKDIQEYYSILHPREDYNNIDLSVEMGRRASTKIIIDLFGKEEDPRALSSEGHLDSLGLCIFLAFVNKFNSDFPLLILDDVVTTIDCSHREKIGDLLFTKFKEKQMIITTHDDVWFEQLRSYQRAYGLDGNFKNLMISSWNRDSGPMINPYKPRWEKIQEKIAIGDKGVGNEGRQYLEWLLDKLCDTLEAPVPYNSSKKYEVWELLPPIEKRLEVLIDDAQYRSQIERGFLELKKTLIMGNLLSHYNILLDQVSIEEVQRFCESVHNLHLIFLCQSCGEFVKHYPELKELRCENSRCNNKLIIKTK